MTWQPSSNLIADLSHAGWGAAVVLGFALFGHALWGATGMLAFAAVKEFAFDKLVEAQPDASNVRDFVFYSAGISGASLAALIKWLL